MEKPPRLPPVTEELRLKIIEAYQVCQLCGYQYGAGISADKLQRTESTWTMGQECNICGKTTEVTEFRDFGYANARYSLPINDIP